MSSEDDNSHASVLREYQVAVERGFLNWGLNEIQQSNKCCALDHCVFKLSYSPDRLVAPGRCIECGFYPHKECYRLVHNDSNIIPRPPPDAKGFCLLCLSHHKDVSVPDDLNERLQVEVVTAIMKETAPQCFVPIVMFDCDATFDAGLRKVLTPGKDIDEEYKEGDDDDDDDDEDPETADDEDDVDDSEEDEDFVPEEYDEEDEEEVEYDEGEDESKKR